ncbi:MAG TPA: hypothetical protein DDW87_13195 [Firmicutes bacterium]|nr:hypothetical protein [Bacillota bacterium]
MVEAGAQEILQAWREEIKRPSLKKAEELCLVASQSVGRTKGSNSAVVVLQNVMTEYEFLTMQLEQIEELMKEYLLKIPNAMNLKAIKGVGQGIQ